MKTKIELAGDSWNPVTGCNPCSEGCRNCYAKRIAARFWGERKFSDIILHYDRLQNPKFIKKPAIIFVNSMSDLFHDKVPFEFVDQVNDVMEECLHQHQFIILTKRVDRMEEYVKRRRFSNNVALGASIETQEMADLRLPVLLRTHAACRIASIEPMLEMINIREYVIGGQPRKHPELPGLDAVFCGGETGPGCRIPPSPNEIRSLRDTCRAAGVTFFLKQMWGEKMPVLDGKVWDEFPEFGPAIIRRNIGY